MTGPLATSLFGVFTTVVVLIVAAWIAIFGGIGALLSRARNGSASMGFCLGLLGPPGWWLVWVRTEEEPRRELEALESDRGDGGWS